jgi:gentisate 1,2-dioxygenase
VTDVIDDAALQRLYRDFAAANLKPLWTEIGNLMPEFPEPEARPCR